MSHVHVLAAATDRCECGMSRREWLRILDRLERMAAGYFG